MTLKKEKKFINLELVRKEGLTYLRFNIPDTLEDIFKKRSKEIRESASWPGLKFYYIPEITTSNSYKNLLNQYYLIDDYGSNPYNFGKLNIAFLRTVGGKGEILLPVEIPFSEISTIIKNCVRFIKAFYQEYLTEYKVKGIISIEV